MTGASPGRALQAVLVDLDGTLVDTEPYWTAGERELTARYGITWTAADALEMVGNDLLVSGHHLHGKGVALEPERIVEVLVDEVRKRLLDLVPWLPGARSLLAGLAGAGVPVALVTMSYRSLVDAFLLDVPTGWFTAVVTGDEVSRGKPHPEPYRRAAELLGVDPARCVAIEDSRTGLASAEAAGCVSVAVPHLLEIEPAPGRTVVESLEDVDVDVLEGLVGTTRSRSPSAR